MGLKFSLDDPYILSQAIQTANNNQSSLQATLAETDFLRGSSVTSDTQALNATLGTPFPSAYQASQNTVGAALGGVGQEGTYSEDTDGGGLPCFIAGTPITLPTGFKSIFEIEVQDKVLAFDSHGKRIPKRVIAKFVHLVDNYTLITFADGRTTGVVDIHKYWQRGDVFTPIRGIDAVWHWNGFWESVAIAKREVIYGETLVYNFTVEDLHCYIANGDAVSNLKPAGNDPFGG